MSGGKNCQTTALVVLPDYVHYNPVKHGHVAKASEWSYSSIHRYIRFGVIDTNWGVDKMGMWNGGYGEF